MIVVGLGVLWEFWGLVRRISPNVTGRAIWMTGGVLYIGLACLGLVMIDTGLRWLVVFTVIAIDTGAYFAGRAIGGPKIAPAISPSKTWAGLGGAILGAGLVMTSSLLMLAYALSGLGGKGNNLQIIAQKPWLLLAALLAGAILAIVAQSGDFFESWMKRRAGVKDSGALIPGHGGLFDRVDGLLPVAIIAGGLLWIRML
ncbi:MAG: phosphatidate cytidylyltransferase [Sphingobium sp.]